MSRYKGAMPKRTHGWGAYVDRKKCDAATAAAEITDAAFSRCVACGEDTFVDELRAGYCAVCARDRVFIASDILCLQTSERALCLEIEGEPHWFPKSQFCLGNEVRRGGDRGTVVIKRWIAEKKGL